VLGYVDVYHSYHGPEAVAVEPKVDGTYDVINGRHRIVAARDAGLTRIPARVVR
jgi:ParB-like chromosome segregation protein Spo0J